MRRRTAAVLCLTVTLTGCYSWRQHAAPLDGLRGDTVSVARAQLAHGTPNELRDVTVRGDSLFGRRPYPPSPAERYVRVSTDTVASVETRHFRPGQTVTAVLLGGAGTAALVLTLGRFLVCAVDWTC